MAARAPVCVARADRVQDPLVLGQAALEAQLRSCQLRERGAEGGVDRFGHARQRAVPRRPDDRLVEVDVGLVVEGLGGDVVAAPARPPSASPGSCPLERSIAAVSARSAASPAASTSRIRRDSRYSPSRWLARPAATSAVEHVGVEARPNRTRPDLRAAAVTNRHQSALGEGPLALAHDADADPELGRELRSGWAAARPRRSRPPRCRPSSTVMTSVMQRRHRIELTEWRTPAGGTDLALCGPRPDLASPGCSPRTPPDGGSGPRALSGRPMERARRRAPAGRARDLRHLRPRQRLRPRPGA